MKKKLILLVLTLFMLKLDVVFAADAKTESCKNASFSARPGNFESGDQITVTFSYDGGTNLTTDYNFYNMHNNKNGLDSIAFCRNAGEATVNPNSWNGKELTKTVNFACKKSLLNVSISSDDKNSAEQAYEKGIIEILRTGYADGYSADTYAGITLALRVFEKYFPSLDQTQEYNRILGSSSIWNRQNEIIKVYANEFIDNGEIKQKLGKLAGTYGSQVRQDKILIESRMHDISWSSSSVVSIAKDLVNTGLDSAIDYMENGAPGIYYKENASRSKTADGIKYTHSLKVQKFESANASIVAEVICDDCPKYGVNTSLNLDGNAYNGENIIDIIGSSGEFNLEVIFSEPNDSYSCQNIPYSIKLTYYDDAVGVEVFILQDPECPQCQEFFLMNTEDVPKTLEIKNKANLCIDETTCATIVGNAECNEGESNFDIMENVNLNTDTCDGANENSIDVVNCVIESDDPAGNSYQETQLVSNQFCSIYCKEDYHFVLPGIQSVNSGRYFSLKASIKGKKTCYTSKIDKEDEFKIGADRLRKNVIDRYNTWIYLYTMVNTGFSNVRPVTKTYTDTVEEQIPCPEPDLPGDDNNNTDWNTWNSRSYNARQTSDYCGTYCKTVATHQCFTTFGTKALKYYTYNYDGTKNYNTPSPEFGQMNAQSGSCGSGTCETKTHQEHYDEQDYPSQLENATQDLEAAIKEYADYITDYNMCFGEHTYKVSPSNLAVSQSVGWKMDYPFKPDIYFWYEESYMNDTINKKLDAIGGGTPTAVIENHYEKDNGKIPVDEVSEKFKGIQDVIGEDFVCYGAGVDMCAHIDISVGISKYVKQEQKVEADYITPTQFYTIYPSGGIVVGEPGQQDQIENSNELTNLLPVGLGTRQGVYNYVLKVEKLGEFYNEIPNIESGSGLGRIWGDAGSVLVTALDNADSDNSCTNTGSVASSVDINGTNLNNGVYVCSYKVNCPDCPVECAPTCKNPECPENNCPVECVNCVYTNNQPNVNYRPITPGDINPNDKETGVNWKWDENGITTGLELKGYVTSTEIEEDGEKIYDIDYEDTTQSINTDFAMQITLDGNMINKIKSYNDEFEGNDGYANNSLKCYDHLNSNDGKTYKNIYCYSTFIDMLLTDSSTADNVKINGNRLLTEAERRANTQTSGYWTTWSEVDPGNWTISTANGISYYKQNYQEIGIGPSWK